MERVAGRPGVYSGPVESLNLSGSSSAEDQGFIHLQFPKSHYCLYQVGTEHPLESAVGRGTTFAIYLPRVDEREAIATIG